MKMPSGIQTYRCGTSRTPSPTEKTARNTNASGRDVEDAIPYRKSCQECRHYITGCRGRHPLHFASRGHHPLQECGTSRTPSPTVCFARMSSPTGSAGCRGRHPLHFASQGHHPLQECGMSRTPSPTFCFSVSYSNRLV